MTGKTKAHNSIDKPLPELLLRKHFPEKDPDRTLSQPSYPARKANKKDSVVVSRDGLDRTKDQLPSSDKKKELAVVSRNDLDKTNAQPSPVAKKEELAVAPATDPPIRDESLRPQEEERESNYAKPPAQTSLVSEVTTTDVSPPEAPQEHFNDVETGDANPSHITGVVAVAEPWAEQSQKPSVNNKKDTWWKDRRTIILFAVAVLLLIGLIVAVCIAITQGSNQEDQLPEIEIDTLPGNWTQIAETISGARQLEKFGKPLALSKDGLTVIGGATDITRDGCFLCGGAYVHRLYDNIIWRQLGQTIVGNGSESSFGAAVSINANGSVIAIGGYMYDPPSDIVECCNAGYAQVYRLVNETVWEQMGSDLFGEAKTDRFGLDVSLSDDGTTLAVGARQSDRFEKDAGTVRIFRFVDGDWVQLGQHLDGEAEKDRFGESLSLSGDGQIVAIGSKGNGGNGEKAGHVRVYRLSTSGNWSQVGEDIDGQEEGDEAGYPVSLSSDGTRLAIGAFKHNGIRGNATGQVRVFELSPLESWQLVGQILEGEEAGDGFGKGIALSQDGSTIAVGAPFNSAVDVGAGRTRVFRLVNDRWARVGGPVDGFKRIDGSGGAVGLSGDGRILAVGAASGDDPEIGTDAGLVRVFALEE